jgi:rhodanese-related sulfurtransferase
MDDLCTALRMNPGHLLLDVRSKGEYSDTSTADNLNIGHLKDAVHIDIREMPTRWREIAAYKDKPVFVYCSHSNEAEGEQAA